jgi:hypothetical protein
MSEPTIEERLDALQRESEERRQELRRIAAELPAAMSRTALLRGMVAEVRHAPNKGEIARRAAAKAARAPRKLARILLRRGS